MQSYKDLWIWQESKRLVKAVYVLTASFPPAEIYAMTSQLRRAAVSISSNIAEGAGRGTLKEYIHFHPEFSENRHTVFPPSSDSSKDLRYAGQEQENPSLSSGFHRHQLPGRFFRTR